MDEIWHPRNLPDPDTTDVAWLAYCQGRSSSACLTQYTMQCYLSNAQTINSPCLPLFAGKISFTSNQEGQRKKILWRFSLPGSDYCLTHTCRIRHIYCSPICLFEIYCIRARSVCSIDFGDQFLLTKFDEILFSEFRLFKSHIRKAKKKWTLLLRLSVSVLSQASLVVSVPSALVVRCYISRAFHFEWRLLFQIFLTQRVFQFQFQF